MTTKLSKLVLINYTLSALITHFTSLLLYGESNFAVFFLIKHIKIKQLDDVLVNFNK